MIPTAVDGSAIMTSSRLESFLFNVAINVSFSSCMSSSMMSTVTDTHVSLGGKTMV